MHPEGDLIQVYESRVSIWSPFKKKKKKKVENPKDDETPSTVLPKSYTKILGAGKQKGKEKEKPLSELRQP